MLRKSLVALVACILLLSSPACCEDQIVTLGFVGALTGDLANYGIEAKNAAELAMNEINAGNYMPGRRLRLIYEDGKCSGREAMTAARKLIHTDHVPVILGGGCSGEILGMAPVAENAEVVVLASFASHPDITKAGDFIFRVAPSDVEGGRVAAEMVLGDKRGRVAAITENTDYALGVRDVFHGALAGRGAKLVADENFNSDLNDLRPLLLRIRAAKPDALFLNPQSGLKGGLLVKQVRELNWDIPLYGTFAFSSSDALKAASDPKYLEGLQFTDVPPITTIKGRKLIADYQARYGAIQSEFLVTFTYDTVYLIADAIRAHGAAPTAIRDYLYELPIFHGAAMDYHFDKNGDVAGVSFARKIYRNGQIVCLSTGNLAPGK
jgi:branched-chain amino acid transport system substrate-binding protein